MNKPAKYSRSLGFTLIELLVVISIIGLLATILVANFNAARGRARDAQRISDIRNIQTALRLYFNDNDKFPDGDSGNTIIGCNTLSSCDSVSVCEWGDSDIGFQCGGTVYMSTLPRDPLADDLNGLDYRYSSTDSLHYLLLACLENASNDRCTTTATWCPGCIYQVQP